MNKKDILNAIEINEYLVTFLTNEGADCEKINMLNNKITEYKKELENIKKREYAETVKRFAKACDKKYYVTLWEGVPYYEAAEGGYYYEGKQIVKTMSFNSRKKAMKYYAKNVSKYFDFRYDIECLREWGNGNYNRYDNTLFETVYTSAYIGNSYGFCVTHGPFVETGKQEYC